MSWPAIRGREVRMHRLAPALLLFTPLGLAAREPVVAQGRDIAEHVCSVCHVVSSEAAPSPLLRPPAPAFDELASRPDMSVERIRRFLATTHWDLKSTPRGMPDPMLEDEQRVAVARYLMSLRRP
jgi:mono/diheme cytochrome c family protein